MPRQSRYKREANRIVRLVGYEGGSMVTPVKTPVKSVDGLHDIESSEPLRTDSVWEGSGGRMLVDFHTVRGNFLASDFKKYKSPEAKKAPYVS